MENQEHNSSNGMEYKREFISVAVHIVVVGGSGCLACWLS